MELGVAVGNSGKFHSLSSFCLVTCHGSITWETVSPHYLAHFIERIKLFLPLKVGEGNLPGCKIWMLRRLMR